MASPSVSSLMNESAVVVNRMNQNRKQPPGVQGLDRLRRLGRQQPTGATHGIFDVTTPGQIEAHLRRPYGSSLEIVTYNRPPWIP